jgi:UDP:flavonoid glycosyltransferase YjiC (YdhE family)
MMYVGKMQPDRVPRSVMEKADALKAEGRLLEVDKADFGILFKEIDAFIVHGGLGTTVEAMRMRKPVAVTGILLMDQRFWGEVCFQKGIGPAPVHIDNFSKSCVDFVNQALDPYSKWAQNARELDMGDVESDGVRANVTHFASLLDSGNLRPVRSKSR